jgi:hypothetical protein
MSETAKNPISLNRVKLLKRFLRSGYEANGGGFNNALRSAKDAGAGPRTRRDQGERQSFRFRVALMGG